MAAIRTLSDNDLQAIARAVYDVAGGANVQFDLANPSHIRQLNGLALKQFLNFFKRSTVLEVTPAERAEMEGSVIAFWDHLAEVIDSPCDAIIGFTLFQSVWVEAKSDATDGRVSTAQEQLSAKNGLDLAKQNFVDDYRKVESVFVRMENECGMFRMTGGWPPNSETKNGEKISVQQIYRLLSQGTRIGKDSQPGLSTFFHHKNLKNYAVTPVFYAKSCKLIGGHSYTQNQARNSFKHRDLEELVKSADKYEKAYDKFMKAGGNEDGTFQF